MMITVAFIENVLSKNKAHVWTSRYINTNSLSRLARSFHSSQGHPGPPHWPVLWAKLPEIM